MAGYVYLPPKVSGDPYTVGFYAPEEEWIAESDWPDQLSAAQRVNWLNGGSGDHSENLSLADFIVDIVTQLANAKAELACAIAGQDELRAENQGLRKRVQTLIREAMERAGKE